MRTRPLPQRHAYDFSLFCETIQATMNKPKNRAKGPLEHMHYLDIDAKVDEEREELYEAMSRLEQLLQKKDIEGAILLQACADVEHEAADVVVPALAAFISARNISSLVSMKDSTVSIRRVD